MWAIFWCSSSIQESETYNKSHMKNSQMQKKLSFVTSVTITRLISLLIVRHVKCVFGTMTIIVGFLASASEEGLSIGLLSCFLPVKLPLFLYFWAASLFSSKPLSDSNLYISWMIFLPKICLFNFFNLIWLTNLLKSHSKTKFKR